MIKTEIIKSLAKENRYTIAELERVCQFGQGTIKRWTTVIPGIDKVERVADVLGCSIDELCGRHTLENPAYVYEAARSLNSSYTEEDYAIMQAFHTLNDSDKLAVMNLIVKLSFSNKEEAK